MKNRLGQNFLIDKRVAEREVKYADISKKDVVLEVGPGRGVLTKILAEKACKVVAVEIDDKLVSNLESLLPENVKIINRDVLKIDFNQIPRFNKIVSNLPFQISSPITFKLLDQNFDVAVLIYQKEFAKRLVAEPGCKDYSRLSVGVYYRSKCEILETIPNTAFYPRPKVDSCIVKFTCRNKPPFLVSDENFFFELTKKLFNQRRKKIKNVLTQLYKFDLMDLPNLDKRVEELTPKQIGELSNIIVKSCN